MPSPVETPLPKVKVLALTLILIVASLNAQMIFSFISFMIVDFGITDGSKQQVGYYAGVLASAFYIGQCLGSPVFGWLSDKWGRRPVLLITTTGSVLGTLCFGFSPNYYCAIAARFITGLLDSCFPTAKTYCGDITDKTNRNSGFSAISLAWALGSMIGPMIGGFSSRPAVKYPSVFGNTMFQTFPYALPVVFSTILGVSVLILSYFVLPETKDASSYDAITVEMEDYEDEDVSSDSGSVSGEIKTAEDDGSIPLETIKDSDIDIEINSSGKYKTRMDYIMIFWGEYKYTILSIGLYCMLCLNFVAFDELFAMWAFLEPIYGGVAFSTDDNGITWAVAGAWLFFFQMVAYTRIAKRLGVMGCFRLGCFLFLIASLVLPHMSTLYLAVDPSMRASHLIHNTTLFNSTLTPTTNATMPTAAKPPETIHHPWIVWVCLLCTVLFRTSAGTLAFTSINIVVYIASPAAIVGKINGISFCVGAILKTMAPSVMGSLFAWSQTNGMSWPLNYHLVWLILAGVGISEICLSLIMPKHVILSGVDESQSTETDSDTS